MTKSTIQSLKKENDDLKSKLEALTKHFKALKEILEKKESMDKMVILHRQIWKQLAVS